MEELDPGDGDEEYWKMVDFQNYSKSHESSGKLSWMWRKGLSLGKKMVWTGVVVSSASFVLPPLVALSAIGVAFSVPAGFVCISYACGEKLMSILLPVPSSTPYEDNGTVYCGEEEYTVYRGVDDKGFGKAEDLEIEEHKFEEDLKEGLEMRIESNQDFNDYDRTVVAEGKLDERSSKVSEIVEEECEENVRENVENEEQHQDLKAISEILEGINAAEDGVSLMEKENDGITRVTEIVEDEYQEGDKEYISAEEQPLHSKTIPEILEGINGVENEISLMDTEDDGITRVTEIVEEDYEEGDDEEYIINEEQPLHSKTIPETLEGTTEVGNEISSTEKEDSKMTKVAGEIVEEGYEEDDREYIAAEEQPLTEVGVEETMNEMISMEMENGGMMTVEDIVKERPCEEDDIKYIAAEEQSIDSEAISEILEGVKEVEDEIYLMEKEEVRMLRVIENDGEGYEEDIEESMADEERPIDSKAIPKLLEGNKEESETSLLEKEVVELPCVSLRETIVAAQFDGELEINVEQVTCDMDFVLPRDIEEENVFAGLVEDNLIIETTQLVEVISDEGKYDQKRKDSSLEEKTEEDEEFQIVSVKDMSHDRGNKNLTVLEEVDLAIDGERVTAGLESENNVEQEKVNMATVSLSDFKKGNEFSGVEGRLIEKLRDEGNNDQIRDSPVERTLEGNEENENMSVKDMFQDKFFKKITIPKGIVPAIDEKGVLHGLGSENILEQETEDMPYMSTIDIKEENRFAGVEEDELKSETMGLIEKMKDEGKDDGDRKDNAAKETPEGDEESGRVLLNDWSQDKGNNKNLSVVPKGLQPAIDHKGARVDLKNDVGRDNMSIGGDESKSSVENQLEVNVKIEGDHTVTNVHKGTGSDKLETLSLSEEDTWEDAVESGFDLSDNGTVSPLQNSDSFDKMPEGEDQSLDNIVEVTVDFHEVAIESAMPKPELIGEDQSSNKMVGTTVDYHNVAIESAVPVSEHAETVLDQGSTTGSDKVKPDADKVWGQINAMRTIVGYAKSPHQTFAEELKALYDFTGVELPASSNDPADLIDINEKLHFLMSIVGVKD